MTRELEIRFLRTPYQHLRIQAPQREGRLAQSLQQNGQQFPISVIISSSSDEYFDVIDGHRRVKILKGLEVEVIRARVLPMEPSEALLQVRVEMSESRLSPLEEGWLIHEIHENFGHDLHSIAIQFNRSVSWVDRRLNMVRFLPASIQKLVQGGKVSPYAAMKILIPLARVNTKQAAQFGCLLAKNRFSTREAENLYRHFRNGSTQIRNEILARPARFLRLKQAIEESDPRVDINRPGLTLGVQGRLRRILRRALAWSERLQGTLQNSDEVININREKLRLELSSELVAIREELLSIFSMDKGRTLHDQKGNQGCCASSRKEGTQPSAHCQGAGNLTGIGEKNSRESIIKSPSSATF